MSARRHGIFGGAPWQLVVTALPGGAIALKVFFYGPHSFQGLVLFIAAAGWVLVVFGDYQSFEHSRCTWTFPWPERGVTVILLVLLGAVTIGAASRMHVSTREDLWALCATLATLAYGVLSVGRFADRTGDE